MNPAPTNDACQPGNQQQYWDRVAGEKTFTHPFDADFLQRALPPSAAILDVGCGYGRTCRIMRDLGYPNCVGVDTSAGMITVGHQRHPDLDLRHLETPALPFPDASVDGVILMAVLTCIPSDADQQALIADVQRILKPGGWLHVSDYFLQPDARNQARYKASLERFGRMGVFAHKEDVVLRHHEPAWIEELLSPFHQHALHRLPVPTMNGNESTIFQYWGQHC